MNAESKKGEEEVRLLPSYQGKVISHEHVCIGHGRGKESRYVSREGIKMMMEGRGNSESSFSICRWFKKEGGREERWLPSPNTCKNWTLP